MNRLTLALPSKGAIAEPTWNFLRDCGLKIDKPNPRQYTGSLPAISTVDLLFQRVKDVAYKVADGTAQMGITGRDVVEETPNDNIVIVHDKLGYGHCKLVIAVPEAWIDVESVEDLADISLDFRERQRRNLRLATTFSNLTRQFLHRQGIHHFTLVKAEGAIEAAPTIGYADAIVDLVQTGTTLRENNLKPLLNGVILESQACLIANRKALQENPELLDTVRILLEYIDAALSGKQYSQITVNIQGADPQEIAEKVSDHPATCGLLGPTIAPIYTSRGRTLLTHCTVTIIVENKHLLAAVNYLRSIGGLHLIVSPVQYIFMQDSATYVRLLEQLEL